MDSGEEILSWEIDAHALIQVLESDDNSIEFRQPVNYVELGLVDYLTVIKIPMDLSTVKVLFLLFLEKTQN